MAISKGLKPRSRSRAEARSKKKKPNKTHLLKQGARKSVLKRAKKAKCHTFPSARHGAAYRAAAFLNSLGYPWVNRYIHGASRKFSFISS
jgi:23S rRNA maturation mini-RNase III